MYALVNELHISSQVSSKSEHLVYKNIGKEESIRDEYH